MSISPISFLNRADMMLNLWDMFLEGRGVDSNAGGGNGVLEGVNFAIHEHFGDVETAGRVY